MKKLIPFTLLISILTLGTQALAQSNATTSSSVWVVRYIKIKPGKAAELNKFLREYRSHLYTEAKRQGLIEDFKFYRNPYFARSSSDSRSDWDLAIAVSYRNYAEALDGPNEENEKKWREIRMKIFGSQENMTKLTLELYSSNQETVDTQIIREVKFSHEK